MKGKEMIMPSYFEKKNGEKDSYYTMYFPSDKEAWDYADENNLKVIKVERTHDGWILWYQYY